MCLQGKNGGYWVVAANDAVPNGLLGYTDTGSFVSEDIPQNIGWVLEQYGDQIAFAAAQEEQTADSEAAATNRHAVAPIVTTQWGQTGVYNKYCPELDGHHCPHRLRGNGHGAGDVHPPLSRNGRRIRPLPPY